jgi:hypothetical protein
MGPACLAVRAASKEFWRSKDPAAWTSEEKQALVTDSPWAREGYVRMLLEKDRHSPVYGRNGRPDAVDLPDTRPGVPPGGTRSYPIGEKQPPPPEPDANHPVQFRVRAVWESAKPVRLAGGPELPESIDRFYVIRLHGVPLMPIPKTKQGEAAPDPNEDMLRALKENGRLQRKGKPDIACDHLFTASSGSPNDLLLFFPRAGNIITTADKVITLESRFALYYLSVQFFPKDMKYRGELAI